jgi:hypothetical protein
MISHGVIRDSTGARQITSVKINVRSIRCVCRNQWYTYEGDMLVRIVYSRWEFEWKILTYVTKVQGEIGALENAMNINTETDDMGMKEREG